MSRQGGKNLLEQPPEGVRAWLRTFNAVITDCDGVLWSYGNKIEGSMETINKLKKLGKKVFFCTNNSSKTRNELFQKATQMGYNITEDAILSTAHATASYLQSINFKKKAYIIGNEAIVKELDAAGISHTQIGPDPMIYPITNFIAAQMNLDYNIGAVVVAFDEHFSFPKMCKAASYLNNPDCLFIATNMDENFRVQHLVVPSSGGMVRAIETSANREAMLIGKPNPDFCAPLIEQNLINPAKTLMIGDRANTDILLGHNCGFHTLLVGSGVHQMSDIEIWKESTDAEVKKLIPDFFVPTLGDLLQFL